MMRRLLILFAIGCGAGQAQQPIGTVGVQNATVQGALEVKNGQAILMESSSVVAGDHAAEVALSRGGSVRVCATSGLRATAGKSAAGAAPLMLALDRGAMEVKMPGTTSDVVMTPDLRFTLRGNGPLDLQLRVTRNGDTCVENRGAGAPALNVAEQFGDASYELRAGQHVLFEHGSLKEVVDQESSSCGCPAEPTVTVADALLNSPGAGAAKGAGEGKTAAEEHPFPAAVSAGLAAPAKVPQAPAGAVHAQVSATLSSDGGADSTTDASVTPGSAGGTGSAAANAAGSTAGAPGAAAPVPTAQPVQKTGLVHAVGRFFRRIFGGG